MGFVVLYKLDSGFRYNLINRRYLVPPTGRWRNGFDCMNEDKEAYNIVKQTIGFMKDYLLA